ncbi:MAG: ABC transporter permease subunit [Planctomycetota bacterium]
MRKIWAILRNTYHEIVRQPIFYFLVGIFSILLFLSQYLTLFAFGAEISMMKEMAIASITLCGLLLALFSSTTVITEEIENKTVITVLSKPIYRYEFILGKFFGIVYALFLVVVFQTFLFTLTLWMSNESSSFFSLRNYYDFVQSSSRVEFVLAKSDTPDSSNLPLLEEAAQQFQWKYVAHYLSKFFLENLSAVYKGIFLSFVQIILLCSLSIMMSCFFSTIVNVVFCFFIFVLGHLWEYTANLLHQFPFGRWIATWFAWLVPNLEYFNLSWAISINKPIPGDYLLYVTSYGLLYTSITLLVAIFLFKNREVM